VVDIKTHSFLSILISNPEIEQAKEADLLIYTGFTLPKAIKFPVITLTEPHEA
jgi:hypothetical protein